MKANAKFLLPLIMILPLRGSRLINLESYMLGSSDVRDYKRIHHRSQKKLRRLGRS